MDVVGILMMAVFLAVQAGFVFLTAWLGVRVSGRRLSKSTAMTVSCTAWILAMLGGYLALGGENAFRDGYGLITLLCVAEAVSAVFILRRWNRPRPA